MPTNDTQARLKIKETNKYRHLRTKQNIFVCRCGLKFTDQNSLADHRFFCDTVVDYHAQPEVDEPQQVPA